jgi:hypothetical protein
MIPSMRPLLRRVWLRVVAGPILGGLHHQCRLEDKAVRQHWWSKGRPSTQSEEGSD